MHEEKKNINTLRAVAPFLTLGIQLAVTVVVFFFIGQCADGYFGTKPWLMVGAVLLGITGGMIKFFRTVIQLSDKEDHERQNNI